MAINPFVQPDYTGQVGAVYKGNIDTSVAALARLGVWFMPQAQSVPDLTVRVGAGVLPAAIGSVPLEIAAQNTAALVAPVVDPRKDIVYVDTTTGAVGVAAGAEAAVPVDPAVPAGKIPIARVNWTVGMAEIVNADLDDLRFGAAGALIERVLALDPASMRTALALAALALLGVGSGLASSGGNLNLDLAATTAETSPAVGDFVGLVDVSAANATRTMTLENLFKVINGLTEDTTPDGDADFVVTYDASAGGAKKVKTSKFGGGNVVGLQVITATDTYTPTAGATSIVVEVIGAGGGSGGVSAGESGGGGGGGYAKKRYDLTGASTGSVTIGAAGAAGTTAPGAGGAGGNTSFTWNAVTITGNGGSGSAGADGVAAGGAAGGSASGGDINVTGGSSTGSLAGAGGQGGVAAAYSTRGGAYGTGGDGVASGGAVGGQAGKQGVVVITEFGP